jgi:hypothetical protein
MGARDGQNGRRIGFGIRDFDLAHGVLLHCFTSAVVILSFFVVDISMHPEMANRKSQTTEDRN